MFRTLLLSGCLLVLAVPATAQRTPERLIEAFAERIEADGPRAAVDSLFATNEWMMRNQDTREQVGSQLANLLPLVGDYLGMEHVATKRAGESLVLHSYLFKYERQPVRFNFMFYRPEGEWGIYRFSFDDSFDAELEEANKLYFLDLGRY